MKREKLVTPFCMRGKIRLKLGSTAPREEKLLVWSSWHRHTGSFSPDKSPLSLKANKLQNHSEQTHSSPKPVKTASKYTPENIRQLESWTQFKHGHSRSANTPFPLWKTNTVGRHTALSGTAGPALHSKEGHFFPTCIALNFPFLTRTGNTDLTLLMRVLCVLFHYYN